MDYPNLFDISIDLNDTDDAIVSKIRMSLSAAQSRLASQITLPANHRWSQLVQSKTSSSINLADVILSNADIKK